MPNESALPLNTPRVLIWIENGLDNPNDTTLPHGEMRGYRKMPNYLESLKEKC